MQNLIDRLAPYSTADLSQMALAAELKGEHDAAELVTLEIARRASLN